MAGEQVQFVISGDSRKLITALKTAGFQVDKFGKDAVKGDEATRKFSGGLQGINKAVGALGLAVGAQQLLAFGKGAFDAAAQAERLGIATDALAKGIGESGDSMVEAIQRASSGTIDKVSAMEAANKTMLFGLVENSTQMEELTKIAINLGSAMGQDSAKSVDDLTTALGKLFAPPLRNQWLKNSL